MNKQLPPAIGIQALAPLSEQSFSEVFAQLKDGKVSFVFEQRQQSSYASLEWLIPTGIILFITHSYFDGIFKEIGKDHYQWFKGVVSSLYRKALGKSPEIEFKAVSAGKKKGPSRFSGSLSFVYASKLGYRVKLLFPMDLTVEDYALSCEEFMKLIVAHEQNSTVDALGREIENQAKAKAALAGSVFPIERTRPTITLLVFWNRLDQCIHVADPVASSRGKKVVSKVIGS